MAQLGFCCFAFLLFIMGKGKREEISSDSIKILQSRAQNSQEYAQYSAYHLRILFDFLSSYLSLYSACFFMFRSLCQHVICHFFLITTQGNNRKNNKLTRLFFLCRDMKLQILKPFFKRAGDSINCSLDLQFQHMSFIVLVLLN